MKKKFIGLGILLLLIVCVIVIKVSIDNEEETNETNVKNLTNVTVAVGGGKEGFITNERVNEIMNQRYGINVIYDNWSNGKLVVNPLLRENGDKYDLMFCSD